MLSVGINDERCVIVNSDSLEVVYDKALDLSDPANIQPVIDSVGQVCGQTRRLICLEANMSSLATMIHDAFCRSEQADLCFYAHEHGVRKELGILVNQSMKFYTRQWLVDTADDHSNSHALAMTGVLLIRRGTCDSPH